VESYKVTHTAENYPLKFAFACSIDHPGCGELIIHSNKNLSHSLPALIQCELDKNCENTGGNNKYPHLTKGIVDFTYYKEDGAHPHASCTLPKAIARYFNHVEYLTNENSS
jgi:hypothetical protein